MIRHASTALGTEVRAKNRKALMNNDLQSSALPMGKGWVKVKLWKSVEKHKTPVKEQ